MAITKLVSDSLGAGVGGSLVKLSSADFTTQTSVTVDNVFTADYSKYKILLTTSNPTNHTAVKITFRDSTPSDLSLNQYGVYTNQQTSSTTVSHNFRNVSDSSEILLTNYNTAALYRAGSFDIDLYNIYAPLDMPNTNLDSYECFMRWTIWGRRENSSDQFESRMYTSFHKGANTNYSIRGVKFYVDAGTITGTYGIYGYTE